MPRVADTVSVDLDAHWDKYVQGLSVGQRAFDRTMRNMVDAGGRAERQITAQQDRVADGIRNIAAGIATGAAVGAVTAMADSYTKFTNQLRLAGLEGGRLSTVQDALYATAQRNGVEIETLGTLYGRLAQAGKELGATDADLIRFTNGVAAAIRIQGGSAAESSGALLQLSQALAGGIVRAEEFNSVNEGARPILVAVANGSDRFKGSVSALRNEILKGTVTSKEFYEAFLRGSSQLEAQAGRATLTTAQGLTILRNALTRYIGEADLAVGASRDLGSALGLLASNLGVIIPAIAAVGLGLGIGFVTNAARASLAARGVTGSLVAMRGAMLAAFGGPVGIAVTAVALALGSFAMEAFNASAAARQFEGSMTQAQAALDKARGYAGTAAANVNTLGGEALVAEVKVDRFAGAVGRAAQQLYNLAAAKKAAAIAELQTERIKLSETVSDEINRTPEVRRRNIMSGTTNPSEAWRNVRNFVVGEVSNLWTRGAADQERGQRVGQGRSRLGAIDRQLRALNALDVAEFADEARAGMGGGATAPNPGGRQGGGRQGGGAGSSGPTPDDLRLQARLDAARAAGNEDQIRALEDVLDLQRRIDAYKQAGLSTDAAGVRAAQDQALVFEAREQAFDREQARLAASVATEVARTAENLEQVRQLERKAELEDRIEAYRRSGLALEEATSRAAGEQAQLDLARAGAAARRRRDMAEDVALQVLQIEGAEALGRSLEDQRFVRAQTLAYQETELSLADATLQANRDLAQIQAARARAQERYLADLRAESEINQAEARGDERAAGLLRTRQEAGNRVRDRVRNGQDPTEAAREVTAQMGAEARAELQGVFRQTFRDGVMAALEGDLGQFFQDFVAERSAAALEEGLNRIADVGFDFLTDMFPNLGGLADTGSAAAEAAAEAAAQQAAAATIAASLTGAATAGAAAITGAGTAVSAAITAAGTAAAAAIAAASATSSVASAVPGLGGGKARGGRTYPGMAYPVNEGLRGSEWFIPDGPGVIVPQGQGSGGSGGGAAVIPITLDNRGPPMRMRDNGKSGEERRLTLEPIMEEALTSAAKSGALSRAERSKRRPVTRA